MKSGLENGIGELVVVFVKVLFVEVKRGLRNVIFFYFFQWLIFIFCFIILVKLQFVCGFQCFQYVNGKVIGIGGVFVWWCNLVRYYD